MKTFNIQLGYCHSWDIEVEDFECAQDAFDKLVDQLEADGYDGFFITADEADELCEDQYSIGGNHSRYVLHDGLFYIKEVA